MRRSAFALSAIAMSLLSFSLAHADDRTAVVKFKPGATSATIGASLKGYDMNTYVLGANAGQTLVIHFKPSNTSCYYNVNGPTGDEALFNGSTNGNDFSAALTDDGNYQAKVYLMRNAARRNETCKFSITFEIRD